MSIQNAGSGAAAGAAIGSTIVPPFGTAAGAVIGAIGGILAGRRSDREKAAAALVQIKAWLAENGVDAGRLKMSGSTRAKNTAVLIEQNDIYAAEAFRRILERRQQSSVNIPSKDLEAEINSIKRSGWLPVRQFINSTAGGNVAGVNNSAVKWIGISLLAVVISLVVIK